jgi:hypothetical protein
VTTHRVIMSAALALLLGVTACAAPSQPFLDSARINCASGNQMSCSQVPALQAQVNEEHAQQSREVGLGILAVLGAAAAGASAGYAASHPVYQPVYVCRGWGCW